jgi:hypothetical protein
MALQYLREPSTPPSLMRYPEPNNRLQLTPYSVRCAPASGRA